MPSTSGSSLWREHLNSTLPVKVSSKLLDLRYLVVDFGTHSAEIYTRTSLCIPQMGCEAISRCHAAVFLIREWL